MKFFGTCLFLGLFLNVTLSAQVARSYTEVQSGLATPPVPTSTAPVNQFGSCTFYSSLSEFQAACGTFPVEDFSGSGVTPAGILICTVTPVNSTSGCVAPLALIPGFNFQGNAVLPRDVLFLGAGIVPAITSDAISTNRFVEPAQIIFDGNNITSVAFEFATSTGPGFSSAVPVRFDLYNTSNVLIGTTVLNSNATAMTQFAMSDDEPIRRIVIEAPPNNIEIIDNLTFGTCNKAIPTLGQWSLIILGLLLSIFGVLSIVGNVTDYNSIRA